MKRLRRYLLSLLLVALLTLQAKAGLVVVVNADSGVTELSRDEVINIFLGRYRQYSSGLAALPIDQPADQPESSRFYRLLVNKELAEINAYWARLIFSGKTSPPMQAASGQEVIDWVSRHRGGIGYIERDLATRGLRVVFSFSSEDRGQ